MPFKPGKSGNPEGRPVGSVKSAALRSYQAVVKALGTEVSAARIYALVEERTKTADLDELLMLIDKFAGPVVKEMVKDNKIEVSTTDELAAAIQAALLSKAAHGRPDDS